MSAFVALVLETDRTNTDIPNTRKFKAQKFLLLAVMSEVLFILKYKNLYYYFMTKILQRDWLNDIFAEFKLFFVKKQSEGDSP